MAENITALTNYGGGQGPADLTYIAKPPFGPTDDRKSTLADLFDYYNKNTTDGSFQMQGIAAPSVSAAGVGKFYFDSTSNTFKISQNGGAFFDIGSGNLSGSLTSGRVPYASGATALTDNAGLTFTPNALTIGTAASPGGLRLVGLTGNYWNLASQSPASSSRTFYFPDNTSPTTGNFLFVGTFGSTVQTDWSTGLTWSNSTKQITVTASTNAQIGLGVQNTNAGTAAECVVGFTANGGAISLISLTSTAFTTSGLYKANQLYWRGTTGITEMLFALDDASTAFKFGVNNAVAASINATSTEGLVLGIASTLTGRIKLYNSAGATYTQISAGNAASSLNYILPATAPTAGQVLTAAAPSGSNVTLSWGAGGGGALAVNNVSGSPTFAGVTTLLVDDVNGGISAVNSGGNPSLGVVAGTGISVTSSVAVDQATAFAWTAAHTLSVNSTQSATTAGTTYQPSTTPSSGQYRWSPAVVLNGAANSGSGAAATGFRLYSKGSDANGTTALTVEQRNLQISATWFQVASISQTGGLSLGVASQSTGGLTLFNSAGATSTTLQAGNAASSLTFVWPAADPTAGQVLSASAPSGGTVTLSWAAAGGGTTINSTNGQLPYRVNGTTFGDSAFASNALNSTYLQATSGASGAGLTLTVAGGGSNENLILAAKGTGSITSSFNYITAGATIGYYTYLSSSGLEGISGGVTLKVNGTQILGINYLHNYALVRSDGGFGWSSDSTLTGSKDVILSRDAANTLAQRNGANAQTFRVYNTYTDASDYERLNLAWVSNEFQFVNANAGTGSIRSMAFVSAPSASATSRIFSIRNNSLTDLGGFTVGGSLVLTNLGTAPTASVTDACLTYVADAAAGDAQLFARNEAGFVSQLTGNLYTLDQDYPATTTTLANITGGGIYGNLSANVQAGKSYNFRAVLLLDANATGGWKVAMGGTCTATTFRAGVLAWGTSAGLVATLQVTALGSTTTGSGVNAYEIIIEGYISVNAAGTLTVQFAQNSASGTSYVKEGSYFQCWLSNR